MNTRAVIAVVSLLLVVACTPRAPTPEEAAAAAKYRAEQFTLCMASLPKGPDRTVYNDWDEVVDSCKDFARIQNYYRDGTYR